MDPTASVVVYLNLVQKKGILYSITFLVSLYGTAVPKVWKDAVVVPVPECF